LSAIVLLVIVLAGVGLWRMSETHQQVEQIVNQNTARLSLVHRMRDAVRDQLAILRLVLHLQDPQRQREEIQNAVRLEATFITAHNEFAAMPLTAEEQQILKRVRQLANRALNQVVGALDKNDRPAIKEMVALEPEIAGLQRSLTEGLDSLLALQQQETENAVTGSRKGFEFTRLHILVLASFVIGAGLMIAPLVIRKANRQAEERQHQAMYDAQTQLPNQPLLVDRLRQAVSTAHHEQRSFGLLRIDIDHFSEINRQFGRAIGDQVLQYVAACTQGCLSEPDTLARMEDDEFAVLSMTVIDLGQAISLAKKIRHSIGQPLEIAGQSLALSASVGVVMFPHHGEDSETLLSAAGEALRLAQQTPRGYRIYSADMKVGAEDRVALIHELHDAIVNSELTLHYQPKVDIGADRVSGVEALVRWQHPVNGLMVPDEFLPLAEQVNLIKPLTDWVLDTAMRQSQEWIRSGVTLPLSVKVTAASVQDPEFPRQMAARLARFALPAEIFEIELKDSIVQNDPPRMLDCLRQLKEMGFQIALGDFGTGDSPMMILTEYLVANIKLDKTLVRSMADNKGGIMAVRSAVNLGRTLGLQVVAKGVESQDSWDVLRGFGCNAAQGFYLSGPLPPVELVDWLHSSQWAGTTQSH